MSRSSARTRRARNRLAKVLAIGVALAVPLAGLSSANLATSAAATPLPASMSATGEASAPKQQLGPGSTGKIQPPPVGKNTVVPPSLRSMFPLNQAAPEEHVAQTPPKEVSAAAPEKPENSFDAKTSRELPERRDRFSQTFVNTDKTETTVLSQGAVNFQKKDGSWAKINAALTPAEGKGGWEVISNSFYSWIAPKADSSPLVQLELGDGHNVGWGLEGAADVAGQMTGDKVVYPGFSPNADLELVSQATGVKETIILGSKSAARSYTFPLQLTDNLTPAIVGNEVVLTDEKGVERAKIPAGSMEDSSMAAGGPASSSGVVYQLTVLNGKPALKVLIDSAWLDDPARVYPVRVDPTFYWTESQKPTYALSAGLNGSIGGGQELQIGCRPGPGSNTCPSQGWNVFASYLSFPDLVPALKFHKVFTARLDLLNYQAGSCAARWVDVHGVTQAWQNIPQAQIKFPGPPVTPAGLGGAGFSKGYIATGQSSSACKSGYQSIDFATSGVKWIQDLADGKMDNWGLAVRARNQTDPASWKKFAGADSANPPRLVITHSPYRASYAFKTQAPADYITQDKAGKFPMSITNLGAYTWQPGIDFMTYRVFDTQGNQVNTQNALKTQIPTIVSHLGKLTMSVAVQPLPGSATGTKYRIQFTMVHQDGSVPRTFTDWGTAPLTTDIVVRNVAPVMDPAAIWPLNGAQAGTLSPQVWAAAIDPDAAESTLQYHFELCEVVGTDHRVGCFLSGDYTTSKTWIVPRGKLEWNKEYEWRPYVRDNDGTVSAIGPMTIFTDAPQPLITSHLANAAEQGADKPYDPQLGNYTTAALDIVVPVAGPDLNVARTYNSLDPRRDGVFGAGWSSRYDMSAKFVAGPDIAVKVTYPDGNVVKFARNTDGTYSAPRGSKATLTGPSAGPWTLQIASGAKYDLAGFVDRGHLTKIYGAQGKPVVLSYSTDGKLAAAASQDGAGRKLSFTWTADKKHIASVSTDPVNGAALTWTYEYAGDVLVKACNSDQKCTVYGSAPSSHYRSAVLDSKPDAYYRMSDDADETDATNEIDITQQKELGKYVGVTAGQDSPLAGVGDSDKSVRLNGASGPAAVGLKNGMLIRSRDSAVEMWFKTTSTAANPLIGYQNKTLGTTPTAGMPLVYVGTDGKLRGQYWNGSVAPITSTLKVNDGQWHHVALSVDDPVQSLYLDDSLVGLLQNASVNNSYFPIGQIGAASAAAPGSWPGWGTAVTRYFDGQIDEVALYSHPLSGSDVDAHYQNGRNAADQLTSITSPSGKTAAQIDYDPAADRVEEYIDTNGGSWKIGKPAVTGTDSDLRRTVMVSDPGNRSFAYEYDALGGWLLRTGRPYGAKTRPEDHPSPSGREADVIKNWPYAGYSIRSFTHDKTGKLTKITNEVGAEVSMTYDSRGNVNSTKTCRTGATDCKTEYSVYHASTTWSPLDPRWDKLAIFRDGRSASATDDTYRRSTSLNVAGDFITERSPDGGQVDYTYTDGIATGPDGQPMPIGLLRTSTSKVTGTATAQTQYLYDRYGQLTQLTAPSGVVTKYTYDEVGRKRTETQVSDSFPAGVTTTYDYDKMSRVVGITGPVTTDAVTGDKHQQKAELEYDDDGNLTRSTVNDLVSGEEPRVSTYEYDDRDRLIRTVDADGKESQQGYDQFGNKTWSQDSNGARWEYAYSELNMLTEVRDANMPSDPNEDPENTPEDGPTEGIDYTVRQTTWYDPAGRKSVEIDPMKRVTKYVYNGDDSLKTATLSDFHNPDGTTRDYVLEDNTYDGAGHRLRSVTDNGKTTTDYTYDLAGRVTTTTIDPVTLKRKVTYAHDLAGNVTQQQTTGGWSNADIAGPTAVTDTTNYVFDTAGRTLEQSVQNTDGSLLKTSWTYDQRGLATSMTQPRGNVSGAVKADFTTTYDYDEVGRQIRTTSPKIQAEQNGAPATTVQPTTVVGYGAFGLATSTKDALGNITKTAYDKLDRPIELTGAPYTPPGGPAVTPKSTFQYDPTGHVVATTDELGNTTRYNYDHLGQQVQIDAPSQTNTDRAVTQLSYTASGQVESSTDPLGAVKKFTYDDLDRLVTSTEVERKPVDGNFTTRITYDDMDNVTKAQTPSGASASNTYDSLGQLIQSSDPNGVLTKIGYDYAGRQVRTSDGLGRSAVAKYDSSGQLISTKTLDAANTALGTTQLAYDADGNLVTSTPASGKRPTTYTYDALGDLTKQVDPVSTTDSITIGYGYDAAGNRTRYTDGRGNSTIYTANTLGLPEKVIEPSTTAHPAAADRTWSAAYDASGNTISLLAPGGVQRTRTFDAAGRLTKEDGTGAEVSTATRQIGYDLAGHVTSLSSPGGSNTYEYNDRGMLLRADGPSGTSTQGYDADGQLTQRIDAAGTADFTYTNGRPKTVTDSVTRTVQTLGYNTAGQLSTIDYGSGRVRTVGYDAYGRQNSDSLKAGTAGTVISSMTYGYDADNNITSKKTTGVAGASDNTYVYDQLGRLTSWTSGATTTAYGWDAASNRVKAGTAIAQYDERNRLITDGTSTYAYSPRGSLVSKKVGTTTEAFSFDAFDRMITSSGRDFAYDALDRPVSVSGTQMKYDGFSDEVVTDGSQTFGRSAGDGLLSVGYAATKRLILADRHGDVVGGFDPADTTLASGLPDSRSFDPFGKSTAASGTAYRVGYQGDWTDPNSGDVNQGARWYDPDSGTFNSRDSMSYAAGVASSLPNLYAYATGNPVTLNDPTGNRAIDPDTGETLKQKCHWETIVVGDGHQSQWTCEPASSSPGDQPNTCKQKHNCPRPPGDGGCKKNCGGDGGCKKNCGGDGGHDNCVTKRCDTPPPPPKCDAECQRLKKLKDQEDKAQHNPVDPPGKPTCSGGNPTLCSSRPDQPSTTFGGYEDRTGGTDSYTDTIYQNTLDRVGSVVGSVTQTGSVSMLQTSGMMLPGICQCGGPGNPAIAGSGNWGGAGDIAGTLGGGVGIAGIFIEFGKIIDGLLHNDSPPDADSTKASDPHGLEDETGFTPEELGELIKGHVPEDRFADTNPNQLAEELEQVLADPNTEVKAGNAGPWLRDEKHGRTILLNSKQPWRSTAFNEPKSRWDQR